MRKSVPCFLFNFQSICRSNCNNPSRNLTRNNKMLKSLKIIILLINHHLLSQIIDFVGILTLFPIFFIWFVDKNFNTLRICCFLITSFSYSIELTNTVLNVKSLCQLTEYLNSYHSKWWNNQAIIVQTSSQVIGIGTRL